jgi:hypothetical protein
MCNNSRAARFQSTTVPMGRSSKFRDDGGGEAVCEESIVEAQFIGTHDFSLDIKLGTGFDVFLGGSDHVAVGIGAVDCY